MRPLRLGVALLATSGLAACAVPEAASVSEAGAPAPMSLVGEWTSVDTLSRTHDLPPGDYDGGGSTVTLRTLKVHLSITDSMWTETMVYRSTYGHSGEGTEATEFVTTYRADGDSVFVRYGASDPEAAGVAGVRQDTLTLAFGLPRGEGSAQRFVRSEPLGVPPDLVGFWVGLSEPDAAGVPAEFGFRFDADGTYEDGWSEPAGEFRVVGPYLLLREQAWVDDVTELSEAYDEGALPSPFQMVFEMELDPAAEVEPGVRVPVLRLGDGREGGERIVLFRRPQ